MINQGIVYAKITKTCANIQDWTAVNQNTVSKSSVYDYSDIKSGILHIQASLDTTTAHTGTEFIIQISSSTSGDRNWNDLTKFVSLIGTANSEPITNNPLSIGSTTITCISTTGYTAGGWRFIKDGISSELIYQTGLTANTNITIIDGTTNTHVLNTMMYNIAMTQNITIPSGTYRLRILVNNTYDNDGSTLYYNTRITTVT